MANFMMPRALRELAEYLAQLPGIGRRTADRLALALLDWDEARLTRFSTSLAELKERVRVCTRCGNLGDEDPCAICADPERDATRICVVENARQVAVIERSRRFFGMYHVLGGHLAPLDGVDAEDLTIDALMKRLETEPVQEVILATSPDVEGEATATYLAQEIRRRFTVSLSRIALGIPVGADLSFADAATIGLAMETRRLVEEESCGGGD